MCFPMGFFLSCADIRGSTHTLTCIHRWHKDCKPVNMNFNNARFEILQFGFENVQMICEEGIILI